MELYQAITKRRTVRDFSTKSISQTIIKRIIAAGLSAPSNSHLRQWEFVIVNDQNARFQALGAINQNLTIKSAERIVKKSGYTNTYQKEMYMDAIPKQHRMLLTAGCLIIPCFRQDSPLLKPKSLSELNGFASIWCCIENMLLAAASEGIYGVTRIPFDKEISHLRSTLGIPEEYSIPCYLALGYPDAELSRVRQLKIKAIDRMHYNKW